MKRSRPTTLEPLSASMFVIVSLHLAVAFGVAWWWHDYGPGSHAGKESKLVWMNPSDFRSQAPPAAAVQVAAAKQKPKAAVATPQVKVIAEEPPVQKATLIAAPPEQTRMEPVPNEAQVPLFASSTPQKPAANRSITLRRVQERLRVPTTNGPPAPPITSPTLLDIARLNTLRLQPPPPPAPAEVPDDAVNMDAVDEALNAVFLSAWTPPPIDVVPAGQREARLNVSIGKDGTLLKSQMSKFSGSHALDQSILEAAAQVKKISATLPSQFSKESYDLELNFIVHP